jgi:hypothetical protein
MYSIVTDSNSGSSLRGWMQSTGQTSTQAESFVPMQGSVMTNGMDAPSAEPAGAALVDPSQKAEPEQSKTQRDR